MSEYPLGRDVGHSPVHRVMLGRAGRGLESNCAQDFCQSLEEASPEIRACVEACNHIANATREQNDFSSVSRGHMAQRGGGVVGWALIIPLV